jgi:argininosuccinate synthase
MVENRVIGMKSRGVYETPAEQSSWKPTTSWNSLAWIKDAFFKLHVAQRFAEILYEANGSPPLCKALCAFVDSTQNVGTGTVTLKLFKGSIIHAGASSPYSLYDASWPASPPALLLPQDSTGFINLSAFPPR